MNWDILISTYPSEKDDILRAKSLQEQVDEAMNGMEIPVLDGPCPEERLLSLFPDLARVCSNVWRDYSGSEPSFDMTGLLLTFANKEAFPEIEGINEDALQVILTRAFSRLLFLLREKNSGVIPDTWSQGSCPFCGAFARVGFDSETGRVLHCPTCGHAWRYPRVRCTVCGNADHSTLGYFEAEGLEGIRVSFCKECSHYIKVIDTGARDTADPETEDALSLEMDNLAVEEGFIEVP